MLYFLNERRQGTRKLQKDLSIGHLQPGIGKNSKDLAILILEFDDVTVKTIYSKSGLYPSKKLFRTRKETVDFSRCHRGLYGPAKT